MLGIIDITPELTSELQTLAEWAARPENWYDIEAMDREEIKAPGDDTRYVKDIGIVGVMHCIFSWTIIRSESTLWRHLSISIPEAPTALPNQSVSYHIAGLLGFTGGPSAWLIGEGPGAVRNINIIQPLPLLEV